MIVQVEDRSRIKKVHFKCPHLFKPEAEEDIINMYKDILETDNQLALARQLVRDLEKELKQKKDKFNEMETMFTIEYEQKETEHVDRVHVNMAVINPSDVSNRSYTGQ